MGDPGHPPPPPPNYGRLGDVLHPFFDELVALGRAAAAKARTTVDEPGQSESARRLAETASFAALGIRNLEQAVLAHRQAEATSSKDTRRS